MVADHDCCARNDLARGAGNVLSSAPAWRGATSILIGDHIETQGNAECLQATAAMFGWEFGHLNAADTAHVDAIVGPAGACAGSPAAPARASPTIIAIENAGGAEDLFRFRAPDGPLAVVVGNERKGISRPLLRRADRVVQIPIASRSINTINVAAAAAVALYYLSRGRSGRIGTRGHSGSRPEVLLAGAIDAIELGSAVRTAACLGWTRLFVQDRGSAWFAADRVTRSLGRGAARRARNPVHVLPLPGDARFDEVCVVSARGGGTPLQRTDLARGPRQLVVIPDETAGDLDERDLAHLGRHVRRVHVEIERGARHPFRSIASIALAECARQVGSWRRPIDTRCSEPRLP